MKPPTQSAGGLLKLAGLFAAFMLAVPLIAQEAAPAAPAAIDPATVTNLKVGLDTVWVLVTAMLVFWMNAGFALVESGLCQSKNCVNILAKNFIVFAASTVSFWFIGWGLMFGDGSSFVGSSGLFFLGGADNSPAVAGAYQGVYSSINWTGVPLWAKFFFQLVFAGTAATIVSGAVAERIKFSSFLIFSFLLVAFIYPISGHWIWGGGWLGSMNFRDFAGSTVVHSVGGWAALAGVLVLGPRLGKFKDGKVHPIPGHNMTSAALGVLILWLGWFGFNPGSTMGVGDGSAISHVLVATNMAAATGSLGAAITAWILLKKPDLSMILNGCLAGLVAITASCAFVTVSSSAIIGLIAGIIVVPAVIMFDKLKIDDPVGALSVHLVNGIWGTLSVGVFYDKAVAAMAAGVTNETTRMEQLFIQIKGVLAVGAFAFLGSLVFWYVVKLVTKGIRVKPEEELEGLDIGEHGNEAYPDFTPAHK